MATASPNDFKPWHAYVTIDLLARVLQNSLFHPFIAWLIPLCLRATAHSYRHPTMQLGIAYGVLISLLWILSAVNTRIAYGTARDVDLDREVIVITGGASGLGLLIAEVYGLRGASVAVLDVRDMEGESRGVEFYRCDVGDRAQVEQAAKAIEADVGPSMTKLGLTVLTTPAIKLGTPTILVNNAGIVNGKSLLELSPEQIERSVYPGNARRPILLTRRRRNFRVNVLSHFHTIQTFLPGMLRQERGTIVTVSSVLAHLGCKNLCASFPLIAP